MKHALYRPVGLLLIAGAFLAPSCSVSVWADDQSQPAPAAPEVAPLDSAAGILPWGGGRGLGYEPGFADFAYQSPLRMLGKGRADRVNRSPVLGRLWFRLEYLAWDTKGQDLPPLVTTSPTTTAAADAGKLGQPGTKILFGDTRVHDELRSGGRITGGFWWTPYQDGGIEATYFAIDGHDVELIAQADDYPVLARPYTDVVNAAEDALLIAYPNLLDGSTDVRVDFELSGAEVLLRHALIWRPAVRCDLLAGYRYARLCDRLGIRDVSVSLDAASGYPLDAIVSRHDVFRLENEFHGGELGLSGRWWYRCWSLNLLGKLALGGTRTGTTIDGATSVAEEVSDITEVTTYRGGLLALPTNMGRFGSSDFGVLAELSIALEYQVCDDLRVSLAYDFMYWDSVARAAAQVDLGINPTQIPPGNLAGRPRPAFSLQTTDFWAQGLSVRLEYQF